MLPFCDDPLLATTTQPGPERKRCTNNCDIPPRSGDSITQVYGQMPPAPVPLPAGLPPVLAGLGGAGALAAAQVAEGLGLSLLRDTCVHKALVAVATFHNTGRAIQRQPNARVTQRPLPTVTGDAPLIHNFGFWGLNRHWQRPFRYGLQRGWPAA